MTVTVSDLTPPTILSWYSAAVHGRGVGEARLEIPDTGLFAEPRNSGITTLVVTFSEPIDPASFTPASVRLAGKGVGNVVLDLSGIGVTTSLAVGNTEGTIAFSAPLPDVAKYLVQIDGVRDVAGNALAGDNNRILTGLIGDTTGDRRVNVFDLSYAWAHQAGTISAAVVEQVRSDVTLDGRANVFDLSAAWAKNGHDARSITDPVLPPPPPPEEGSSVSAEAAVAAAAAEMPADAPAELVASATPAAAEAAADVPAVAETGAAADSPAPAVDVLAAAAAEPASPAPTDEPSAETQPAASDPSALVAALYQPLDALAAAASAGSESAAAVEVAAIPAVPSAAVAAAPAAAETAASAADNDVAEAAAPVAGNDLDAGLVDVLAGSRLLLPLGA